MAAAGPAARRPIRRAKEVLSAIQSQGCRIELTARPEGKKGKRSSAPAQLTLHKQQRAGLSAAKRESGGDAASSAGESAPTGDRPRRSSVALTAAASKPNETNNAANQQARSRSSPLRRWHSGQRRHSCWIIGQTGSICSWRLEVYSNERRRT